MTKDPTIFTFDGHDYDLKILYGFAITTLKKQFDVHLTSLFEDNNIDDLLIRMYMSDDLALKLWWFYVKEHQSDEDSAMAKLTSEIIQNFKDTWWVAVADFFDPLRRDILRQVLAEAPKALRKTMQKAMLGLTEETSTDTSSSSEPK